MRMGRPPPGVREPWKQGPSQDAVSSVRRIHESVTMAERYPAHHHSPGLSRRFCESCGHISMLCGVRVLVSKES